MHIVKSVVLMVMIILLGLFIFQNPGSMTLKYLNWSISCPIALLAVILYLLGMVSGWGVLGFVRMTFDRGKVKAKS